MNTAALRYLGLAFFALAAVSVCGTAAEQPANKKPAAGADVNLAPVATTSTSFVSGHETITALNDGFDPAHSDDKRHGAYGNWPRSGTQWVAVRVEPARSAPARSTSTGSTTAAACGCPRPAGCKYWDGEALRPGRRMPRGWAWSATGSTRRRFAEVTHDQAPAGVGFQRHFLDRHPGMAGLRFGQVAELRPDRRGRRGPRRGAAGQDVPAAGPSRTTARSTPRPTVAWSKESGPGEVAFDERRRGRDDGDLLGRRAITS